MNKELMKAQDIFLDRINQVCAKFGLNNIMAQLYAILYLGNKALSLNDMVERLKISKGSVSVNIRALERYGAVRKVWVKGSRRDYYEAESDIAKVITDRIKSMARSRLVEVNEMLDSSYHALGSVNSKDKEEKETIKVFKERLEKLQGLQNKAQSLFNLFDSSLIGNLLKSNAKMNSKKEALAIK